MAVGEVSSKYGYNANQFELDVKDKQDKQKEFEDNCYKVLYDLLYHRVDYIDNRVMSMGVKFKSLKNALIRLYKEEVE